MKKIEITIDELNNKVSKEELKVIIYNIFASIVMLMPVIPEIMGFGFYSMKWTLFVLLTVITGLILLAISITEKKFKITVLDGMLITYLLLVFIATFLSKYGIWEAVLGSNGRGEGLLLILCYGATFIIFSKGYKHISWSLKLGIIGSIVVSIYSILQGMLPTDILLPFEERRIANIATGTMRNQNFLSSYVCLFLPMIAFHYINTGKKASLLITLMLFLTQVFSVTLGGYVTFIVMYIVVIIYSLIVNNKKGKIVLNTAIISILMLVSFIAVNYIKSGVYNQELSGVKTETTNLVEGNDNFGTGRMGIWKKSLMAINNNKWFGIGPDSLWNEISKEEYLLDKPNDQYRFVIIDKAHSELLQIAVTTGIPSMVAYILFVVIICITLLRLCINDIKSDNAGLQNKNIMYMHVVLISISGYLMQSVINISVVQVAPIYWAMLGLGAGIIYNKKENINTNSNC